MRLLILAAFLAAPASAAPAPDSPPPQLPVLNVLPVQNADCRRPDVHMAETPLRPELKRLDELPQGDVILSVYTEVDGCMAPVIVRYGEGRAPTSFRAEPVPPRARVFR
jgi:hypothetical protein